MSDLDLKERTKWAIDFVLDKYGMSITKLAQMTNINKTTLGNYRQMLNEPKTGWIGDFCDRFDFRLDWFIHGRGEPLCGETRGSNNSALIGPKEYKEVHETHIVSCDLGAEDEPIDPKKFCYVPFVEARLSAGDGNLVPSEQYTKYYAFRRSWIRRVATAQSNLVLMVVSGNSMSPTIQDQDIVLIDHGATNLLPGRIYATSIYDGIINCKRIEVLPGKIRLKSDNRDYESFDVHKTDFRVIGEIIWLGRQLKPFK